MYMLNMYTKKLYLEKYWVNSRGPKTKPCGIPTTFLVLWWDPYTEEHILCVIPMSITAKLLGDEGNNCSILNINEMSHP